LLNAWAREASLALPDGRPLSFVEPPPRRLSALAYERRIAEGAEIVTRSGSLHDFCNALAWLLFPRAKAALNAMHVDALHSRQPQGRGSVRDAATLLDESGVLFACVDAKLLERWHAHAWREAFWDAREADALPARALVIGHGLLAKCVAPFRAVTAKALVLPCAAVDLPPESPELSAALDAVAAAHLAALGPGLSPRTLLPLPIAALPGWDTERLGLRLFDDVTVFRSRRSRNRPSADLVLR